MIDIIRRKLRIRQYRKERKCWNCVHEMKHIAGKYGQQPCKTCYFKEGHPDWVLSRNYGGTQ